MFSLQAQQAFSFCTKQGTGGGSLSGIKLLESISTEQLEKQPQNLKLLLLGFFFQPAGAQVSYLTNAFSSQESRVYSACPWGAAITFCKARGQQHEAPPNAAKSLLRLSHLIHMLCRQNSPERFLQIAGWARRKLGRSWRSPAAPSSLCLEERVWTSDHHWPCRDLLSVLSWVQTQPLLPSAWENVSEQTTLSTLLGIKKPQTIRKNTPDHASLSGFLEFLVKHDLLALNSFLLKAAR